MILFLELVGVAALILLNAVFVAGEYGLVISRRTRIRELEREGNRRARAVLRITADPPRFIAAMQLGVTVTSLGVGALGEPTLAHAFEPTLATVLAVAVALLLITLPEVVIGELVPKGIALSHPERTALILSGPVRVFFVVFAPLVWFLQWATELVLGLLGQEPPGADHGAHSEAELRMLLSSSAEQGEIEPGEHKMLTKVFDFADKQVADVMVPRPEVVTLSVDMPPEDILLAVLSSPYTRYPVYRDSIDDIVGILHVRDIAAAMHDCDIASVQVEDLLRPAAMVPETKHLVALMTDFKRTNQHMAIVLDEYGAVEGIVTLEDLVEEIVGEIEDEFDVAEETVERVDETTIRIDGTFGLDEFNAQFGTDLPVEDYHTVAGFVFGQLGRAAEPGDEVVYDGIVFRVDAIEGQRIDRLTVTFPATIGAGDDGAAADEE